MTVGNTCVQKCPSPPSHVRWELTWEEGFLSWLFSTDLVALSQTFLSADALQFPVRWHQTAICCTVLHCTTLYCTVLMSDARCNALVYFCRLLCCSVTKILISVIVSTRTIAINYFPETQSTCMQMFIRAQSFIFVFLDGVLVHRNKLTGDLCWKCQKRVTSVRLVCSCCSNI